MCSRWRPESSSCVCSPICFDRRRHLDLLGEIAQQLVETLGDVEGLEHVLLLLGRQVGDVGDEVGELRGRLNLLDRAGDLGRHVGQQRDRLARALLQLVHARGDLGGIDFGLADLIDAGDEERIAGDELAHAEAPRAARHEVMVAVGRGHVAQDLGGRADAMQMLGPRRLDRRVALQDDADRLVGLGCGLGAGDRLRAAERERRHDARKEHDVARRQHDQRAVGQLELSIAARSALRPGQPGPAGGWAPGLRWIVLASRYRS